MYAQQGHAPEATAVQEAEIRHNIRRLSHHASIVLFDGCNECVVDMNAATAIYATFVLRVVAEEDQSRALWPSCPADGWATGVHKLTSMPNGGALATPDNSTERCTTIKGRTCIEVHRPKWKGSGSYGFATVNSDGSLTPGTGPAVGPHLYSGLFPADIPLALNETPVGPQFHNMFSSESPGATTFSSFESMAPTLKPEHWGIHGGGPNDHKPWGLHNVMAQRNCRQRCVVAID